MHYVNNVSNIAMRQPENGIEVGRLGWGRRTSAPLLGRTAAPKTGYIDKNYIYGPKNSGIYYIEDNYIYGPGETGRFYIGRGYIYGPSKIVVPWLRD